MATIVNVAAYSWRTQNPSCHNAMEEILTTLLITLPLHPFQRTLLAQLAFQIQILANNIQVLWKH